MNRLLRVMFVSTRVVMALLVALAQSYGLAGYLCLDDVVVAKRFSKKCPWTAWTWSNGEKHQVNRLHIVVLLWCLGPVKIPVAFRLQQPRAKCRPQPYRTKLQLAQQMISEMLMLGLPLDYLVFDSWCNVRWFTRWLNNCGIIWQSTLKKNARVVCRKRKIRVDKLAPTLKLKWRAHLGVRTAVLNVYLLEYGSLRPVVTRYGHGRWSYIVTNALAADLTTIVLRKRSRWDTETIFRDSKQFAAFAACQCRVPQAMVRHVAFVLLTYVVLNQLKLDSSETVGEVKERLQLHVASGNASPPIPLKARVA